MNELKRAIEIAGGVTALAQKCGVTQAAVSNWLWRGRVSVEGALAIERATGGVVSRQHIRPDIFGEPDSEAA